MANVLTLDDVVTAVAAEDTVVDSAVVALNGLQTQVAQLPTPTTDPATADKINKLVADINSKKAALAAAMVVNTPVPPVLTPATPVVTPDTATTAATASVAANPVVTSPKAN
jgi:hypothetical protein